MRCLQVCRLMNLTSKANRKQETRVTNREYQVQNRLITLDGAILPHKVEMMRSARTTYNAHPAASPELTLSKLQIDNSFDR
jgi:hypothetical protein